MASGHVNRIKQAEHMAAPTNAAKREKSPCQSGAVHTWHFSDMPGWSPHVCCWGKNGSGSDASRGLSLTHNGLWPPGKVFRAQTSFDPSGKLNVTDKMRPLGL
jgi:hypothetical protein